MLSQAMDSAISADDYSLVKKSVYRSSTGSS